MQVSVYKLSIHRVDVIEYALLPIGQLTEEVQEARLEDFKKYRNKNNRKVWRTTTNEDAFYRLLLTSPYPYILSIYVSIKTKIILKKS